MKCHFRFFVGLIFILGLSSISILPAHAADDYQLFLPVISNGQATQPAPTGLVANHLTTDITQIPDQWINAARAITVHYAHTSHGSQILTGMNWLETQDSRFQVAVRSTWQGLGLPSDANAIRFYDGNNVPNNDYITPELFWSTTQGVNYTRSVMNSGLFQYSTWTWCGQQSSNSAAQVNQYLNTLNQLEVEYPAVRMIYFTGHTDGNYSGSRLQENNQIIRDYVEDNQKILFDFADIEQYDPSGVYYPDSSDSCEWCDDYCAAHPAECANLNQMGDCAHSHKLQCKLKAQAFWSLAARLAGWDGVSQ